MCIHTKEASWRVQVMKFYHGHSYVWRSTINERLTDLSRSIVSFHGNGLDALMQSGTLELSKKPKKSGQVDAVLPSPVHPDICNFKLLRDSANAPAPAACLPELDRNSEFKIVSEGKVPSSVTKRPPPISAVLDSKMLDDITIFCP